MTTQHTPGPWYQDNDEAGGRSCTYYDYAYDLDDHNGYGGRLVVTFAYDGPQPTVGISIRLDDVSGSDILVEENLPDIYDRQVIAGLARMVGHRLKGATVTESNPL